MYERVASNKRKTWGLIIGFSLFVMLAGWAFGYLTGLGYFGLVGAVIFAVIMVWGSYFGSARIALAANRANPADPAEYAQLHNIVEALCLGAGLPKPEVYVVDDLSPNAFATGRDPEHAAIAVTTGLLERMDRDELEAVLAHELSHVQNRDILVMTIAVTLVGVLVLLSDWLLRAMWFGGMRGGGGNRRGSGGGGIILLVVALVLLLVSPIVGKLMQAAISRRREYLADADAVLLTRHPAGMIRALEKLRDDSTIVRSAGRATAHLWIEEPIAREAHEGESETGKSGAWLNRLFSTHPPLDDRIAVLRSGSLGVYEGVPRPE
ncbi:MAG: M48 family metalloprotease [Dehalococcoidia bacterium]|nr:M48 family metalloprotease [Dehalococcoidia bacterium]